MHEPAREGYFCILFAEVEGYVPSQTRFMHEPARKGYFCILFAEVEGYVPSQTNDSQRRNWVAHVRFTMTYLLNTE